MEILLEIVKQLNSSVFVLIVILGVVVWGTFKIGNWSQKFKNQDEKIVNFTNLSEKVVALTTKIDLIYQNTNPNPVFRSHSPISLTAKGVELSKKLDADNIYKKYSAKLIELLNKLNPKNAYDIQTTSMRLASKDMLEMLNEEELIKVKNVAFEEGLILEDIMGIFGVYLRNEVLQSKGIALHEVDKHDPEQSN